MRLTISYVTCENRLIGLQTVFNYAKDQLGIRFALSPFCVFHNKSLTGTPCP
jgi:hypothetical protein